MPEQLDFSAFRLFSFAAQLFKIRNHSKHLLSLVMLLNKIDQDDEIMRNSLLAICAILSR